MAWRQSDGAVGGVPGGASGRLWLQPVLRFIPEFERRLSPTMRQDHPAGDKVFVDYSGKKIMIVDRATGVVRDAEIFVAVLGASNYTYAEATWTQTLPDWIEAHVRMFRFFGGVPRLVVPDNLKSGVHRASFYDPEINRSYGMMASHYGIGILPARKPRDKASGSRSAFCPDLYWSLSVADQSMLKPARRASSAWISMIVRPLPSRNG